MSDNPQNHENNNSKEIEKLRNSSRLLSFFLVGLVILVVVLIAFIFLNQKKTSQITSTNSSSSSSTQKSSKQNISSIAQSSAVNSSSSSNSSEAIQYYTNQYFPNLKIGYPKSWTIETTTKNTIYKELVERTLTFSKGNATFSITLSPEVPSGCAGPGAKVIQSTELSQNLYKNTYKDESSGHELATFNKEKDTTTCRIGNRITSNISASDSPDYKKYFPVSKYVEYGYFIGPKDGLNSDDPLLPELENILKASKFE